MIELSLAEIAEIVGGRLVAADPERTVSGKVEFDSRKVAAGDLFLAIAGARVDGHDYAEAAVAAGAVAVLASRPVPVPAILVADPIEAITALARAVARRLERRVIGITGSSGKTSTKDLLAQVLAGAGPTVATPGSFNNELGYPYTVLLADESTRFLVLETSSRGVGHIRHLTGIAAPRLAGVLNVGSAHLSEFGNRRRSRWPRANWWRRCPPQPTAGWRCSTPTTRWSRRWPGGPAPGWSLPASTRTPTCGPRA